MKFPNEQETSSSTPCTPTGPEAGTFLTRLVPGSIWDMTPIKSEMAPSQSVLKLTRDKIQKRFQTTIKDVYLGLESPVVLPFAKRHQASRIGEVSMGSSHRAHTTGRMWTSDFASPCRSRSLIHDSEFQTPAVKSKSVKSPAAPRKNKQPIVELSPILASEESPWDINKILFPNTHHATISTLSPPDIDWDALSYSAPVITQKVKYLRRAVGLVALSNLELSEKSSVKELLDVLHPVFGKRTVQLIEDLGALNPEWLTIKGSSVIFSGNVTSQEILRMI